MARITRCVGRTLFGWLLLPLLVSSLLAVPARAVAPLGNLIDVLKATPQGGWVRVNQNLIYSVCTPLDLQVAPYVGTTRCGALIGSWSGFAWDPNRGNIVLWGGGHSAYGGNEVYLWNGTSQLWERASLPSAMRNIVSREYEAVDGAVNAPEAAHSYDNMLFLPKLDRFLTFGGAAFDSGGPQIMTLPGGGIRNTGPYLWDPSKADANKVRR